jgi:polyferredoxin
MMGEKRTILHSKVERIVSIIGRVGFVFAFVILISLLSRLTYMKFYDPKNNVVLNKMNMFGAFFYLITYFFTLLIFLIPVSMSKSVDNVIIYAIA